MNNSILYSTSFIETVEFANSNSMFIGTGNPNSKILIIGKEAAISANNTEQYNREMKDNPKDWRRNFESNIQPCDVGSWFSQPNPVYNPLYPYKDQLNKILSRNKDGEIIRGDGGTSKTWHNYQKLSDTLFNDGLKSSHINFHEFIFCSELNEITGKYSHHVPRSVRFDSIQNRKEIFKQPFFQQFPITIVAVGHYVRDFEIDLQGMFDVTFNEAESKELSLGLRSDFINIHYGSNDPGRLLIHTNQLSMVSSELTDRLGKVCSNFLNRNNTKTS